MNPRERTLAIFLSGLIFLAVAGGAGYFFVLDPLRAKEAAAEKLAPEVDKLEAEVRQARKDAPRLAEARRRSLPADPAVAKREYAEMLTRILQKAGLPPGYKVSDKTPEAGAIPVLPGGKKSPAYQKVAFDVTFDRADMWAVRDVLEGYYGLNVLHQITHLEIKVEAQPGAKGKAAPDRRDLAVKLSTEAIILDGAEPRRTLLPVSPAFAAAGGQLGFATVSQTSELGRGLTPLRFGPVLSPKNRDYGLIVLRDPFHGLLPPPPPLSIGKIADVAIKADERLDPVRVPLVYDYGYQGKVQLTATVEGGPFKGTEAKIDDIRKAVRLAPNKGETGTGTVTVVAKAANGQQAKATFKVKIDPAEAAPEKVAPPKEDIARDIVLIQLSTASDGTATATVKDNYNPYTYVLEATPRRVKVLQYEHLGQRKKLNKLYRPEPNEFEIDDDGNTATKRHFKVVAIDDGGLVVEDLKPEGPKAAPKAVPGKFGPPRPAAGDAKVPGPAVDPIAAVVGPAAVPGPKAKPADGPVLYRWRFGTSLAALVPVPADEAKRILDRSAATGPVGAALAPRPSSDDPLPGSD
jgi:hypothetical protein